MNNSDVAGLFSSLIFLGILSLVILLVFLVCRQITCWYFKINEIVELLKKIESNTKHNVIQSHPKTVV